MDEDEDDDDDDDDDKPSILRYPIFRPILTNTSNMICVYTKGNLDQPLVGFHLTRYHCWSDIIGLSGRYQWIWEVFSTEKIGVWRFNRDIDKFIPFATAIPPTNQHEGTTCIIMCVYIYCQYNLSLVLCVFLPFKRKVICQPLFVLVDSRKKSMAKRLFHPLLIFPICDGRRDQKWSNMGIARSMGLEHTAGVDQPLLPWKQESLGPWAGTIHTDGTILHQLVGG